MTRARYLQQALPIALLCVLAMALMWPSLAGGIFLPLDIVPHTHPWRFSYERVPVNNPNNSDLVGQIYPRRVVTNSLIRAGVWPLWNPTILTGTPLLADGQLALLYPPSLLFLLLPLRFAFGYYALLQVALAGVGTYLFARRLRLGAGPALIAGISYMFSGFLLTWLQFPEFSGATAMAPWCFWAVERALHRGGWSSWLVAGLILAMPLVCQLQIAFYIYVGVGAYLLNRMWRLGRWSFRLQAIAGFGGAVALAALLSAAQLLPQLTLAVEGQRPDVASTVGDPEYQWTSLLRLVLPVIGGKPRIGDGPSWGPELLQEPQPYAGLLPLLLGCVALFMSRRGASTIFGLLAIGSFALAVSSPLLQLFVLFVPPYRQFADHTRWFVLWGFAVAILAGLGAQALQERSTLTSTDGRLTLRLNRLLLVLTCILLAAWAWRYLQLFTPQSRFGASLLLVLQHPWLAPAAAGLGALIACTLLALRRVPRRPAWALALAVVALDLLWYGGGYNTTSGKEAYKPTSDLLAALPHALEELRSGSLLYPPARQIAFLLGQPGPFRILGADYGTLPPNVASAFGLEDVRGYQSLYLARYNRLTRLIDGKDYTELGEGSTSFRAYFSSAYNHRRLLDMLNVEFILFPPGSESVSLYAPLELAQQDDEGAIYRNPRALPRAWLAHSAEVIADDAAQLARMARTDFDPATTVILPLAPPPLAAPAAAEPTPTVRYGPNQVKIQATATAPAMLVLSDAYADGWQATVDGKPATVYRANYALRAVWLPPGTHTIIWSYRPRSFAIGGMVSLMALVGAVAYGGWTLRRWRVPFPRRENRSRVA